MHGNATFVTLKSICQLMANSKAAGNGGVGSGGRGAGGSDTTGVKALVKGCGSLV